MSFSKISFIVGAMLLSSIEARAWSDNNGSNQSKKEKDFNKKPGDMFGWQKDDKLEGKDHFSADTPLVLPTPSKTFNAFKSSTSAQTIRY